MGVAQTVDAERPWSKRCATACLDRCVMMLEVQRWWLCEAFHTTHKFANYQLGHVFRASECLSASSAGATGSAIHLLIIRRILYFRPAAIDDPVVVAGAVRVPVPAGSSLLRPGQLRAASACGCERNRLSSASRRVPPSLTAPISIAPTSNPPASSVVSRVPFHKLARSPDIVRSTGWRLSSRPHVGAPDGSTYRSSSPGKSARTPPARAYTGMHFRRLAAAALSPSKRPRWPIAGH